MKKTFLFCLIVLLYSFHLDAAVTLPHIFGDHMVLQEGMNVPVWGHANPGEPVTVLIGGHTASTITGKDGRWKVFLGPLDTGGPFRTDCQGNERDHLP